MGILFIGGPLPAKSVMSFQLFGQVTVRPMTQEEEAEGQLFDEIARLGDQDEWWLEKRLGELDGLHDPSGKFSDARIADSLRALRKTFDNAWWRSICRRHKRNTRPDPLSFFGGQDALFRVVRLGECLQTLDSSGKLPQSLVQRLKVHTEYPRATTELEIATCFSQAGFLQEMYPTTPSGKHPEGKVIVDGRTVYYEVTEETGSLVEREVLKAEDFISKWLSDAFGPVNGVIQFRPRAGVTTERARLAVEAMKRQASLPLTIEDDDFIAKLAKASGPGGWVGVSGLEPEPSEIVQRWVRSLFQKARQLPAGEAGVIVASPLFLWGGREVEAAATTLTRELTKQSHTRVCGIIFTAKHVENSGFIRHVPSPVANPRAQVRCDEVLGKLARALFDYPEWM